ncbi:MAG: TldD/PmbA family protein [Bacteroidales bacterium]|nr:TldD/PmbA family protein [Bacteroidales bacterium]
MGKKKKLQITLCIILAGLSGGIYAQDSLFTILKEELRREYDVLSIEENPVYYIDYRVDEVNNSVIRASLGSLIRSDNSSARIISANLKVGDYDFDNTHKITNNIMGMYTQEGHSGQLPIENNALAIQQILWRITNSAYEKALEAYVLAKESQTEDLKKSQIPDFSKANPETYFEEPIPNDQKGIDKEYWETKLKEYTSLFIEDSSIFITEGYLTYSANRKYFVSSEGSSIVQNQNFCQLSFIWGLITNDGSPIPYQKTFSAFTPEGLPAHEEILAELMRIRELLVKLKNAPLADPFSGPAILSPAASGVFFHEIFGHRVEGHRFRNMIDSHTFKDKTGQRYLPDYINISFDPQADKYKNTDLFGSYKYDDQGVKAQKVDVIENGVLKGYLLSRSPISATHVSNGHGRAESGLQPVSRQSNMFVESKKSLSESELRKQLIKACKKQGKTYGYYFKNVIGGFTQTTRYSPNVFNITPIEVYRIFVDGRPDQLVRGVNLIGTPLVMFSEIKGASENREVFNGICGAESGQIPVSTISPALLVNKIETQRQPVIKVVLPILPQP